MKKQQFLTMLILFAIPCTLQATGVCDPEEFSYLYKHEDKKECEEPEEESNNCDEETERCLPHLKEVGEAEVKQQKFREATSWPGKMQDPFYDELVQQ